MPRATGDQRCRCGHAAGAHQHFRRGTDCGLCACNRFAAAAAEATGLGARVLRRVLGQSI